VKIPRPAAAQAGETTFDPIHPVDAFILAAGRGERLRPLTDHVPKPLIDIGGRPIIERHLEALAAAGVRRVVINVAWLGEKIVGQVGDGRRFGLEIAYSRETPGALDTAGGIVNALDLVHAECFLLVNGDVCTDFDFADLAPAAGADGELVLVDNPPHHRGGDFVLRAGVVDLPRAGDDTLTYAGIAWLRRTLFEQLAPGRRALRTVLADVIARGRLRGRRHGGDWHDVGTPQRLDAARRAASRLARR